MAKKHYPVIRSMALSQPSPSTGTTVRVVDTARCLSQANRRLYRYARAPECKIDIDPQMSGPVTVYALRNDWAVHKAVQLAYDQYRKSTEAERAAMSDKQVARWEDFRIADGVAGGHSDVGPLFFDGATPRELVTQGEFQLSQVYTEAGNEANFTWAATSSATTYSVLAEYDLAGNAQSSPSNFVSGSSGPYAGLDADIDGETFENLENNGNNPPYDRDGVNANGPFVKIAVLDATSVNGVQKLSTGYFTAPCGLIYLEGLNAAGADEGKYYLTVKAGDYKGVHAPSLLE